MMNILVLKFSNDSHERRLVNGFCGVDMPARTFAYAIMMSNGDTRSDKYIFITLSCSHPHHVTSIPLFDVVGFCVCAPACPNCNPLTIVPNGVPSWNTRTNRQTILTHDTDNLIFSECLFFLRGFITSPLKSIHFIGEFCDSFLQHEDLIRMNSVDLRNCGEEFGHGGHIVGRKECSGEEGV